MVEIIIHVLSVRKCFPSRPIISCVDRCQMHAGIVFSHLDMLTLLQRDCFPTTGRNSKFGWHGSKLLFQALARNANLQGEDRNCVLTKLDITESDAHNVSTNVLGLPTCPPCP